MKIAFISKGNAVRSIIAESITRKIVKELSLNAEVFSAGVEPKKEVNPLTFKVLQEKGYPLRKLYPKPLNKIPYENIDILITIGDSARKQCDFVLSHKRRESWFVDCPSDSLDSFRQTREEIEELLRKLFKL